MCDIRFEIFFIVWKRELWSILVLNCDLTNLQYDEWIIQLFNSIDQGLWCCSLLNFFSAKILEWFEWSNKCLPVDEITFEFRRYCLRLMSRNNPRWSEKVSSPNGICKYRLCMVWVFSNKGKSQFYSTVCIWFLRCHVSVLDDL